MTEQRGGHTPWRYPALARRLPPPLQPVHDRAILEALSGLGQAHGVADVGEVGREIESNDVGLILTKRRRAAWSRLVWRPLRTVALRSRLPVSRAARCQDELAGALDHSGADRRHGQTARATCLRHASAPQGQRTGRPLPQLLPARGEKRLHACGFQRLARHPVPAWGALVRLGKPLGGPACLPLAEMARESPKAPRRFRLRLALKPSAQVLQPDGWFAQRPPAFQVDDGVLCRKGPGLHRHSPASRLRRTLPPPSRLRPLSQGCWLYDLPGAGVFTLGRGGLLQLCGLSWAPGCPSHPAGGMRLISQSATSPAAFPQPEKVRPPGCIWSGPPLGSRPLRPGDPLTLPQRASAVGFLRFVSSPDATQATGR
jgi:hypothetical protein